MEYGMENAGKTLKMHAVVLYRHCRQTFEPCLKPDSHLT